jgi:hypothetical protein
MQPSKEETRRSSGWGGTIAGFFVGILVGIYMKTCHLSFEFNVCGASYQLLDGHSGDVSNGDEILSRSSVPTNLSQASLSPSSEPYINASSSRWNFVGRKSNVFVYEKSFPNQKLKAFAGEIIADVSLATILAAFSNCSHTLQWVDSLKSMETLSVEGEKSSGPSEHRVSSKKNVLQQLLSIRATKKQKAQHLANPPSSNDTATALSSQVQHQDLVYQLYELWPLPLRDFLFHRRFHVYETNRSISVHYQSIEDPRKPVYPKIVRTVSPFTHWTFQTLQDYCRHHDPHQTFAPATATSATEKAPRSKFSIANFWKPSSLDLSHSTALANLKEDKAEVGPHVPLLCLTIPSEQRVNKTFIRLESFVLLNDINIPFLINYIQRYGLFVSSALPSSLMNHLLLSQQMAGEHADCVCEEG